MTSPHIKTEPLDDIDVPEGLLPLRQRDAPDGFDSDEWENLTEVSITAFCHNISTNLSRDMTAKKTRSAASFLSAVKEAVSAVVLPTIPQASQALLAILRGQFNNVNVQVFSMMSRRL